MSHVQPCRLGFNAAPCPQCARDASDRTIRAELRDRLNRCDDATRLRALDELAHSHPDAVNAALDEQDVPR